MSIIIGIDPGISGAVALVVNGKLEDVQDLPVVEIVVAGKKRKQLCTHSLRDVLAGSKAPELQVVLEHVSSRPGEGAVGAFSFGRGFGQIEGILAALAIPYTLVRPQTWKAAMKVPADKGSARQIAMRLFPSHAASFARVKDDGRAEAALIALYGSKQ